MTNTKQEKIKPLKIKDIDVEILQALMLVGKMRGEQTVELVLSLARSFIDVRVPEDTDLETRQALAILKVVRALEVVQEVHIMQQAGLVGDVPNIPPQ